MNVCVTGGSSGIGFAIASEYVRRGCDVAIIARTQSKLEQAVDKLRAMRTGETRVLGAKANLTNEDEARSAFEELFSKVSNPIFFSIQQALSSPGNSAP